MIRPINNIDSRALGPEVDAYRCNICGELFSYRDYPLKERLDNPNLGHLQEKHFLILDAHGYVYFHRVIR